MRLKNMLLLPEFGFYQPEHLGWKKVNKFIPFSKRLNYLRHPKNHI
jgi:hypothetical protein